MLNKKQIFVDSLFTALTLAAAFGVNLLLQSLYKTQTMIPMIFVLGVFWYPGKPRDISMVSPRPYLVCWL
jgi:hypothetical protein